MQPLARRVCLALAGAIGTLTALPGFAQGYPTKPIRLVVPFPAGGGTDAMARSLAEGLARDLGQTIVVDNKAGAGTAIGNDAVAKSDPDGQTLLLNTSAIAILPGINPKLPYDTAKDLVPVVLIGRAPNVIVVRADSPIRSAVDLLARARANPGRLTYGSAGNGTSTHMAAELLKVSAKVYITHVPYRGASPMATDLLGGQIDLAFATQPSVAPLLQGGRLRALAVTSPRRSPTLPDVPTVAESGVPGYQAEVWYAVFAPAGTPPDVVSRLHGAFKRAADGDEFRKRAAAEGLLVTLDNPQDAARVFREDIARWRKVATEQSIKME